VVVTRLGLTLAALVVTRLGLTLAAVVVAGLRLAGVAHVAGGVIRPVSVATVVVTGLRLAAVPHVAGPVVRSVPLVADRVVGAVMAVVPTVVVAGLGLSSSVVDADVRRMGGVVISRSERRPGSDRRGGDQDAGGGKDGDALHGSLLEVRCAFTVTETRSESPSDGGPTTFGPPWWPRVQAPLG
jgi:hypothetical protein